MSSKIKIANEKDLFMNVALECGLYTQTLVSSKRGISDTSIASAVRINNFGAGLGISWVR